MPEADSGSRADAGRDAGAPVAIGAATSDDAGPAGDDSNVVRGSAAPDANPKIDNQAYAKVIQQLNRFGLDLQHEAETLQFVRFAMR